MKNSNVELGSCSILTIVFIVLKLTGVISWSWIWVLSPVWITAGIVLICIVVSIILNYIVDKM